jgi:hypothetical protein
MTNIDEIRVLVDRYRDWLKDRTSIKQIHGDWIEITTPFLDRHNDYIQMYARRKNGEYELTDDGNTLLDLEASGCALDTPRRKELLKITLNGFAVESHDRKLVVKANPENFSVRKHSLIQAILAVNDLFHIASPNVKSLFKEDVAAWLELQEVRYLPDIQFTGKSGYVHQFDFAIPRSKSAPERILKAINNPTKDAAQSLIFAWLDTREARPLESQAVSLLNDAAKPVPTAVLDALQQYQIVTFLWSQRENARSMMMS